MVLRVTVDVVARKVWPLVQFRIPLLAKSPAVMRPDRVEGMGQTKTSFRFQKALKPKLKALGFGRP